MSQMMYSKACIIASKWPSSGNGSWRSCSIILTHLSSAKFFLTEFIMVGETSMATASISSRLILSSLNNLPSPVPRFKIRFAVKEYNQKA